MDMNIFHLSKEVEEAILKNHPVVALETAFLTHGLPYPHNIDVSRAMEESIRREGALPATIGIIDGLLRIGLGIEEIEILGSSKEVVKVALRDLPEVVLRKMSGGTTVSATVFIAHRAGIKFLVTGGIGGVHRGWEEGFIDVSQDLGALVSCEIAVVSSGIKAVLDIPKTLEVLEILSIPVIGYNTTSFPAFYSSESPYKLRLFSDNLLEIVKFLKINFSLGIKKGVLIANPPPRTSAISFSEIEESINRAVQDAFKDNIKGQALTPYLLNKVSLYSSNKSLITNIDLLKRNAEIGAQLAVLYCKNL